MHHFYVIDQEVADKLLSFVQATAVEGMESSISTDYIMKVRV